MKKYLVEFFGSAEFRCRGVECERETAAMVWTVGRPGEAARRRVKESSWEFYADSQADAKAWFIGKLRGKLIGAENQAQYWQSQVDPLRAAIEKLEAAE